MYSTTFSSLFIGQFLAQWSLSHIQQRTSLPPFILFVSFVYISSSLDFANGLALMPFFLVSPNIYFRYLKPLILHLNPTTLGLIPRLQSSIRKTLHNVFGHTKNMQHAFSNVLLCCSYPATKCLLMGMSVLLFGKPRFPTLETRSQSFS
jgi:hypothetical protein